MNESDKRVVLSQITSILNPNIAEWSIIEVEQFLEIINCGLFAKIVTAFGINGQMLLETTKIEALFIPQLKISTYLLFEKLMFIIDELKPIKYTSSLRKLRPARRESRRPIFITDNLMKMFGMGVDLVRQRNIVLWSTSDLLSFLRVIGYSTFAKIAQETNCDGFIMLYIIPDSRKTVKAFKTLKKEQCGEYMYVSQILLAQHYIQKNKEQQEIIETPLRRRLHSEAMIDNKDNNQESQAQILDNLVEIPQSLDNQNSPTNSLNKHTQQKVILESIENLQKQKQTQNHKSGSVSGGNSLGQSRSFGRREDLQQKIYLQFSQNIQSIGDYQRLGLSSPISRSPTDNLEAFFVRSYYPQDLLQKQQQKQKQKQLQMSRQLQDSQKESDHKEAQFKFARSQYSFDGSENFKIIEVIDQSSELEFEMIQQKVADKPQQSSNQQISPKHQLKDQKQKQQQKGFSMVASQYPSQSIKSIKIPLPKKPNAFLQKLRLKKLQHLREMNQNRINQLLEASFKLPFNLMSFKTLNLITLGQIRISLQSNTNQYKQECLLVDGEQTFGVKGCKFGRHPSNDYCYPDQLSISSRHAIIFFMKDQFFIQDLGSKIGTFKQITQLQIFNGLVIQLSFELQMRFQIIKKINQEEQLKITFDDLKKEQNQASVNLKKQSYHIGRAPTSQIPINSTYLTISANHAKIYYQNNKYYFKDQNSRYGSWMRLSKKETKSQFFRLSKGDKIRISSKKIFQIFNVQINQVLCD